MTVTYNSTTIELRLGQVIVEIQTNSSLGSPYLVIETSSAAELVRLALSSAVGTISSNILTFSGTPISATASGTGTAAIATIIASTGTVVISGLTVGSSTSDIDMVPTAISSGQTVTLNSAAITGR